MIEKSVGEPLRGLVILLILKCKLRISVGTWIFGYRMHLEKVDLSKQPLHLKHVCTE